ncbi:MAG: hypothetical protein OEV59_00445 [Deltaproteobacteria bacterium]|nr:hypothetical protein [Deltaproteobacteria bacterium]
MKNRIRHSAVILFTVAALLFSAPSASLAKEKGVLDGIGEVFDDMGKGIKKLFSGSGKNEGKKENSSSGNNDEKMKKTVNDAYKKLTSPGK